MDSSADLDLPQHSVDPTVGVDPTEVIDTDISGTIENDAGIDQDLSSHLLEPQLVIQITNVKTDTSRQVSYAELE